MIQCWRLPGIGLRETDKPKKKRSKKMQNTIHTINDLAKEIGQDSIEGYDIKEWPGKMITFAAVKDDGYYDPLKDVTYFFPDDFSCSVARNANNGWEFLDGCAWDLTRDDIMDCVRNDATLDDAEVEAEADEICAALEIAND